MPVRRSFVGVVSSSVKNLWQDVEGARRVPTANAADMAHHWVLIKVSGQKIMARIVCRLRSLRRYAC